MRSRPSPSVTATSEPARRPGPAPGEAQLLVAAVDRPAGRKTRPGNRARTAPMRAALHREPSLLPGGADPRPPDGIAVPLRLRAGDDDLAFLSTATTFGTAVDLTAAEVSIEAFLPADERTAEAVRSVSRSAATA